MAHTLCIESVNFAHELRSFVLSIDPARFRRELESAARQRVRQLRQKLNQILETYDNTPLEDRRLSRLYEGLRGLARQLETRPRTEETGDGPIQREWRRYQRRLQASYGAIAARLDRLSAPVPALRTTNYGRSLFHFGAAIFTVVLIQFVVTTRAQMVMAGVGFAAWCWASELLRVRFKWVTRAYMKALGPIAHSHEHHKVNSATWYATALAGLSIAATPLAATIAVAVLGVADPMAALVGRRFGRIRLRCGRTLEGSLAFVVSGTAVAMLVLLVFAPQLGFGISLAAAATAALLGAVAEVASSSLDDNLTIPLAAGLGATLLLGLPL